MCTFHVVRIYCSASLKQKCTVVTKKHVNFIKLGVACWFKLKSPNQHEDSCGCGLILYGLGWAWAKVFDYLFGPKNM